MSQENESVMHSVLTKICVGLLANMFTGFKIPEVKFLQVSAAAST